MSVQLNRSGYEYAQRLAREGHVVIDERDDWSEHQPTAAEENDFIRAHGIGAYAQWHLGVDASHREGTKARYKFPYGDFHDVHRCAVLAVESRAGQRKHVDIEVAAAHLHGVLETRRASV
jgi:hypothetical protein